MCQAVKGERVKESEKGSAARTPLYIYLFVF